MDEEIKDVTLKQGAIAFLTIGVSVFLMRVILGEKAFIDLCLWVFNQITFGLFNL